MENDQLSTTIIPEDLNIERIKKPETYNEVEKLVLAYDNTNEARPAFELLDKINKIFAIYPDFKNTSAELWKKYQDLIVLLKFITLPLQADQEIEKVFRENLIFALERGINIKEKLEFSFIYYVDPQYAVNLTNLITRALRDNKEKIGNNEIIIGQERIGLPPYISNWLRDYNLFFSADKERGTFEEVNYVSQSINARKLSLKERDLLLKILKFYDFIRYPEYEVIVLGEAPFWEQPREREREEELISTQALTATKSTSPNITSLYQGDKDEQDALGKEEKNLIKTTNKNISQLVGFLYNLIFPATPGRPDKYKVVAALRLLANGNNLDSARGEKRFSGQFAAYLGKQEGRIPGISQEFRINPASPRMMSLFLQFILKERTGLSESESARFGMQLVNLLKKAGNEKYSKLVYYDLKSKEFRWGR